MVVFLAHSGRGIIFYYWASVSDNRNTEKLMAFFELFPANP